MRLFTIITPIILASLLGGCARNTPKLDTPPPASAIKTTVNKISPADALPKTQAAYSQFVDVRTPEEYAAGHAARAVNIPLSELAGNFGRIEMNEPVYVICETGRRSNEAANILSKNGYNWVFDIEGGTSAWRAAGLPIEAPAATK